MAEELPVEAMSPEAKPRSSKSGANEVMEGLYFGTEEKSYQQSSYYPDSMRKPYNPDPLVEKDYTYRIYEEMLKDEQVNVALQLKKDLVVGSGWHISSQNEKVKKDLEAILCDEIERPLSEILQDMIQAYEFGFSVSEKIFKNLVDGRLALRDIRPRHPSTWLIHTDEHGNVTRYEQRGTMNSIDVDPNSIIHYVNNSKFQNAYGISDLSSAYQAYMTKRHVTRFYAIFLENAAGPKPIAKYDRRAPQGVVDDIFNAIKKLQTKTAMVIPKDFEMEYLETTNSGDAYIKGINLFNMFIGRALFIPDLLGFSGGESGGGSFALGKEQVGLFYKHIFRRREILERIMDQHIIRPICIYNYGIMDEYPKFKFNPLSDEDATKQAELWIKGVQGIGYVPSIEEVNHFRTLVKFPESDQIEMKEMAPSLGPDGQPINNAATPEIDAPEEEAAAAEEAATEVDTDVPEKKDFSIGTIYKVGSLPGEYSKKVDFKLADETLKNTVAKIKEELNPIVEEIFEDLYSQLQKKKIIQTQDLDRSDSIKLKYLSKVQGVYKRHFRRLHGQGFKIAKSEVNKKDFAVKSNLPISNDAFLAFLEQETYRYVGDWEYTITKKTKNELIKAIKDGRPLSEVISVMDDAGKALSEVSMERYARTKTTEVFNRGRLDYFDSTGIVAAYQFSAILDDVTSEICGNLNGLTFPAGESPIPPLHFNCRSVLIPITKFEDWSADGVTNSGENVDKFLETNVSDKGFSVYTNPMTPDVVEKYVPPKIDDAGVTFKVEMTSPLVEVTTYSLKEKPFQLSTVQYFDEDKKKIKSVDHKRLDDERSI